MRQITEVIQLKISAKIIFKKFFSLLNKRIKSPSLDLALQRAFFTNNNANYFNELKLFTEYLIFIFFWVKIRTIYYTNNWIYTTNHKRIAVNYFWFVILSGIVGMVLATVIRLEFAYPGVGVFAGDSLQYLSLVTAHGVIMVFFMIMPLLLGAFANFLLPTQLGVHDVAFPRLNSAAFWFLPGGLLMLAQLVCVDRRYQRMNCFNIREIESILKKRFFTDLLNTHDHKKLLHKTVADLKFKISDNFLTPNLFTFYNYGIDFTPKNRYTKFKQLKNEDVLYLNESSLYWFLLKTYRHLFLYSALNRFLLEHFYDSVSIIPVVVFFKKIVTFAFSLVFALYSSFSTLASDLGNEISAFSTKTFSEYFHLLLSFASVSCRYLTVSVKFFLTSAIFDFLNFFYFYLVSLFAISQSIGNFIVSFVKNLFKFLTSFSFNLFDYFFIFNILESFYLSNDSVFKTKNAISITKLYHGFYEFYCYYFFNVKSLELPRVFFSTNVNSEKFNSFGETAQIFYENNHVLYFKRMKFLKTRLFLFDTKSDQFSPERNFYSYYNFNSHITYLYILIHFLSQSVLLIFSILVSLFDFKQLSFLTHSFGNLIVTWYLPLFTNDNVFYFFLQKISIPNFIKKNSFFFDFNSIVAFFNFKIKSFWANFGIIESKEIFLFFFNCSGLVAKMFEHFFNFLILLIFDFRTYLLFSPFYHFFCTNALWTGNKVRKFDVLGTSFDSGVFTNKLNKTLSGFQNEELSSNYRYLRFNNPVFKYDYKSGDYYPKLYKEVYPFLITSLIELTGGLRQAPWFFSSSYVETMDRNFEIFTSGIVNFFNSDFPANNATAFLNKINTLDAFNNFFNVLQINNLFLNKRWLSVNVVDQKFYKFYQTSSLQQRIYNNWRQLKFTREAWRCKLLMSRHQKTLFKRYVNEDGVFWSIERNAKDLLPGWAMITPFSSRTRFTAVGKTDIGLMGVLLVLNSSIISAANFIVTYRYLSTLNNRKMRDARSFFTESIMVASWMMIAANPMLVIGIIMLLSDRHWQTSFFDYSGGGDTVLFQHMFWFFGHPEVYIIILPTFGFVNTMLSYYLKKRISARASLLYSMYTIAFLGFFVWGHHMYMVGLAHTTRMLFSTLTVMISVPAATKLMHWCVTTVNSAFSMELPLVCVLTFIFLFVSGGISGMCVAHTGMDVLFHDTFYVIGHFHVMLAGAAMIGSFGAFYFYFVAIFGVKYSRIYAYLHFTYYLLGQLFTVIPMFWLGYAGMPRRVLDYPASFGGWHSVISGGHMLSVAGLIAFFVMIFDSLRQAKAVTRGTFGIGRYNTRLNFYIYEIAKLNNVQEKAWSLFKFLNKSSLTLNKLNYYNLEHYETTLFSYSFSTKNNKRNFS